MEVMDQNFYIAGKWSKYGWGKCVDFLQRESVQCESHLAEHSCFKLVSGIGVKIWQSLEVRGSNYQGSVCNRIK